MSKKTEHQQCMINSLTSFFSMSKNTDEWNCAVVWKSTECSNYPTSALISDPSKVILKILQARLQQYVNHKLPDVQAGFRKGTGTRDQIANICWIVKKEREFQKIHLLLLYWLCQSLWLCGSQQTVENSERDGNTRPPYLLPEKSVCRSRSNS